MDSTRKKPEAASRISATHVFVLGTPLVPEEIAAEGLLTPEDYGAITLDHISRTSEFVWQLQITKRA